MRLRTVMVSLAGPVAFAIAERIAARMEPGYRRRDEPVSALAARGSRGAPVMVSEFVGLAAGSVALAGVLRGSVVAPEPVPSMLVTAGLTTAGAGLARCSNRSCPTRFLGDVDVARVDDLHAAFSVATFAMWIAIPLVAAVRAEDAGRGYRRACAAIGVATLGGFIGAGLAARRPSPVWSGAAQRAMLASALLWFPVAGIAAARG